MANIERRVVCLNQFVIPIKALTKQCFSVQFCPVSQCSLSVSFSVCVSVLSFGSFDLLLRSIEYCIESGVKWSGVLWCGVLLCRVVWCSVVWWGFGDSPEPEQCQWPGRPRGSSATNYDAARRTLFALFSASLLLVWLAPGPISWLGISEFGLNLAASAAGLTCFQFWLIVFALLAIRLTLCCTGGRR